MDVKRKGWKVGFLCLLAMLFIASPASVLKGQTVPKTPYPYDDVGVVMGFSGVYDLLTIHEFWEPASAAENSPEKYTKVKQKLSDWLTNIASNGGNVIRFFSHGNWKKNSLGIYVTPITPWKMDGSGRFNCNPQTDGDWNEFYWTRLDNLMYELQRRRLTAWIDIWDFCSLKWQETFFSESYHDFLYKKHPFYNNNNGESWPGGQPGLDKFFSVNSTVKGWRQKFESRLVDKTIMYNPIYSTNEVPENSYLDFLVQITEYLTDSDHGKGVKITRISHSPGTDSSLDSTFPNILLAIHDRSLDSEINTTYFDKGFKIISSDGEQDGGISNPNQGDWGNKNPLTVDQVGDSLDKALELGYQGMEILDRDEYRFGYEEDLVNLDLIDTLTGGYPQLETLKKMKTTFENNKVQVYIPNGGDNWELNSNKTITWAKPIDIWGTYEIHLYGYTDTGMTYIGLIENNIDGNNITYSWQVGKLKNGNSVAPGYDYKIGIYRVNSSGRRTALRDFSDRPFSITDEQAPPPPPQLKSPANGAVVNNINETLKWYPSAANPPVDLYYLYIIDTTNNRNKAVYLSDLNCEYTITDTSFIVNGHYYRWHVCARNIINGVVKWSNDSEKWTFHAVINSYPPAPILKYPGDGDIVYEPFVTLQWFPVSSSPAVTKYHLQTWQDGVKKIDNSNIPASQTNYNVGPLGNNKAYTWRVRAYNGSAWGPWSETWTVTYMVIN